MTIESAGTRGERVRMFACPFCGKEFGSNKGMHRVSHLMKCEARDD